jgi:uncharacterized protein YwqG
LCLNLSCMGIIARLFGRKNDPPPPGRDVAALMAPLARPAVHLLKSADATRSFFGGSPSLPSSATWPSRDGTPLTFLASIDLASLSETLPVPWLPSSGRLLFFYDVDQQPWGFDPKDRGGWAVMLVGDEVTSPARASGARRLPQLHVSFQKIACYPSWERPDVAALELTDTESDEFIELGLSVYGDSPCHQVGGFPNPIQSDEMELECQLASHGIDVGGPSGYENREVARLQGGAADWRLLLQFDSDDDLNVMWGDAGILYFWIREADARAGRFENAWVVLQCH